ncbi:SemiSWEET family sugar transporter [Rhodoplanes sp. SY1]|uniref:SemiSWEET family sugar transporter n=1 Tax=Rhodoplanes sp. SY1 TaxID=3166646 RepID=UPI0038B65C15
MTGLLSQHLATAVGLVAAFCTTVSYVPQVRKCWQTGRTGDLSLKMFSILSAGIALWVVYGLLQGDPVIVLANSVSLAMLAIILVFKLREIAADRTAARSGASDRAGAAAAE